jgi:hypothetical protein
VTRGRWLRRALVVLVLVGLPATGWVAGSQMKSSRQAAADAEPPDPAVLTEPVVRRALSKRLIFRGAAAAAQTMDVSVDVPANAALAVVTATPVPVGGAVGEGSVVLEVSGRPVAALAGAFPAYRDLGVGDSGPDVSQLEEGIGRLGRNPGRRDGLFDAQLAATLERLWADLGYVAPRRAEPATLIPTVTDLDGNILPARAPRELAYLPRSEVAFVPSFPAFVQRLDAAVGTQLTASPLTLAAGGVTVRGEVPAADVGFVAAGSTVTIAFPDGRSVEGIIATVSAVQVAEDGRRFAPVTVTVEGIGADALGQDLRLTVDGGATSGEVLVVPIVALRTRADGSSDVEVVADGRSRAVDVQPGLSADGFVEVTPLDDDLREGDRVRVG